MRRQTVTIKDIAQICGVSPTVVSAALNNKKGSIAYSKALQEKILKTAAELNYKPNLLGRAMVTKKMPVVANMLHLVEEDIPSIRVNYYIHDIIPSFAMLFNKHDIETIFIPYSDEDSQIRRLQSLLAFGLLGGIVTNIIPNSHKNIAAFLKDSEIPYVINGKCLDPETHCAYLDNSVYWKIISDFAIKRKKKGIFRVNLCRGNLVTTSYPFPKNNHYLAPPVNLEDRDWKKPSNLFVCMGAREAELLLKRGFPSAGNIIIVEDARCEKDFPGINMIRIDGVTAKKCLLEYCVSSLVNWMNNNIKPVSGIHKFDLDAKEIKIVRLK